MFFYLWFCKEPLTFMKPFQCTKAQNVPHKDAFRNLIFDCAAHILHLINRAIYHAATPELNWTHRFELNNDTIVF